MVPASQLTAGYERTNPAWRPGSHPPPLPRRPTRQLPQVTGRFLPSWISVAFLQHWVT